MAVLVFWQLSTSPLALTHSPDKLLLNTSMSRQYVLAVSCLYDSWHFSS